MSLLKSYKEALRTQKREQAQNADGESEPDISTEYDFPVDALPGDLASIIRRRHMVDGTDISMLSSAMFSAASVMIGNTYRVQTRDIDKPTPMMLWMAAVAPSGIGKDKSLSFGFGPVQKWQEAQDYEHAKKESELERRKAQLAMDIRQADKETKASLKSEIAELDEEQENLITGKMFPDDYTFESLPRLFKNSPRGLVLSFGELLIWLAQMGKYNKSGSGADEIMRYIDIYDGKDYSKDRGGSKQSVTVKKPFLSVFGGIQPKVLHRLGQQDRDVIGFTYRFMYAFPARTMMEEVDFEAQSDPHVERDYEEIMMRLMDIPLEIDPLTNIPQPRTLRFSRSALKLVNQFYNHNVRLTRQFRDAETREDAQSIYSRLYLNFLRLCGIMEGLRFACGLSNLEAISSETVEATMKIIEYYRATSDRVAAEMNTAKFEAETKNGHFAVKWKKIFGKKQAVSRDWLIQALMEEYDMSKRTAATYIQKAVVRNVLRREKTGNGNAVAFFINS